MEPRLLQPVELTASGRPRLEVGEVECQLLDAIDMEDESSGAWALRAGIVSLTTHRLLWLDERAKKAWAVPLGAIGQVFASKKGLKSMFSAPRLRFQVWTLKDGRASPQGSAGAAGSAVVAIVFKGTTRPESFVQRLGELLKAQAWKVRSFIDLAN
jgi:ESCRT-II complex subunit VPS36